MKRLTLTSTLILIFMYIGLVQLTHVKVSPNHAELYVHHAKLAYCHKEYDKFLSKDYTILDHQVFYDYRESFSIAIVEDKRGNVVISFSGPRTTSVDFLTSLHVGKFIEVSPNSKTKVEEKYWKIFNRQFKPTIEDFIKNKSISESKSKREDNMNMNVKNLTFVGHSFGGSIAILASYMFKIQTNITTRVYAYGPLAIGNSFFIKEIQGIDTIKVFINTFDLFPLLPRCQIKNKTVRCYRNLLNLVQQGPMYLSYVREFQDIPKELSSSVVNDKDNGNMNFSNSLTNDIDNSSLSSAWEVIDWTRFLFEDQLEHLVTNYISDDEEEVMQNSNPRGEHRYERNQIKGSSSSLVKENNRETHVEMVKENVSNNTYNTSTSFSHVASHHTETKDTQLSLEGDTNINHNTHGHRSNTQVEEGDLPATRKQNSRQLHKQDKRRIRTLSKKLSSTQKLICKDEKLFITCNLNIDYHQIYYGVNVETC